MGFSYVFRPFFCLEDDVRKYQELPFQVDIPVSFFEKSDAGEGKERRIGGIISTEREDQQGDVVIQKGLDFSGFLKNGWFNDNHSRHMDGVLGYPETAKQFKKGQALPNGKTAGSNCTWAEGYLLKTKKADDVWDLAQGLQGTGRSLGFSVEGKIVRRQGKLRKTVAEATVQNVAITHCPVNDDSALDILSKSLQVAETMEPGALDSIINAGDINDRLTNLETMLSKALAMGTHSAPVASPTGEGPKTGEGAGQVLTPQSLDMDDDEDEDGKKKKKSKKTSLHIEMTKSLSDEDAISWVQERIPGLGISEAGRFVEITKTLKRQGKL